MNSSTTTGLGAYGYGLSPCRYGWNPSGEYITFYVVRCSIRLGPAIHRQGRRIGICIDIGF